MTDADHDALTGLFNHRAFDERLGQAVSGGRPFTLALLDVKGLRRIIDEHGFSAGDDVLIALGNRLRSFGAARVGGNVFAVIVDGIDPDLVARLTTDAEIPCTVVSVSSDEATAAGVLELADRRLDEAKGPRPPWLRGWH